VKGNCIKSLLQESSASLGRSLETYWPVANRHTAPEKNPDPNQANVSLHVAHAMLCAGFAVFGEADYPLAARPDRLDVLGISPEGNWFLACEFDKLSYKNEDQPLEIMLKGLCRLEAFWLRKELPLDRFGEEAYRTSVECDCGYGLVGELYWVREGAEPSVLGFLQQPEQTARSETERRFLENLRRLDGVCVQPLPVREVPTGRYYLLGTYFQIPAPQRP